MKIKNKILLMAGVGLLALLSMASDASAQMTNGVFTFINVPNMTATNSSGGSVSNISTANLQLCPVRGAPQGSGQSSPSPLAVFTSCQGGAGVVCTNTYWFCNSYDGVTLALGGTSLTTTNTTGLWSVTLSGNGTNACAGYTEVANTSFLGAKAFALVAVTFGTTNTMTNGNVIISWPY